MIRCYPNKTTNKNIPESVFLVAEIVVSSLENKTTYYIDKKGDIFKVGDWVTDKPDVAYPFELVRLTEDSLNLITSRWESWYVSCLMH